MKLQVKYNGTFLSDCWPLPGLATSELTCSAASPSGANLKVLLTFHKLTPLRQSYYLSARIHHYNLELQPLSN